MPRGHRGGGGRDARWKRKAEHMSYTLRDIASLTGFSKSTISRVINGDTNVKDSTREEIMERLAELGYVPNQIAKGLKSELPLIGVIIQDIRNPYYTQMLYNFDIITKRHGYTLLYMNSNNDAATERSNIEYLLGMKVKGIIFVASLLDTKDPIFCQSLKSTNVVTIGYGENVDTISPNFDRSLRDMLGFLQANGHTELGVCHDTNLSEPIVKRLAALRGAMGEYGFSLPERSIYICDDYIEKLDRDYADGTLPDTIIALTDYVAMQIYDWCDRRGIRIPEQLSVVGCDDIYCSRFLNPPLSTIAQPIERMAEMATNLLLRRIQDHSRRFCSVSVDTEFIQRRSISQTAQMGT